MEGIAFIFIGAAIFTHSWHLLGLYSDTRAFGVVMAGAALALFLSFFVFEPHMLGSLDDNSITRMGELTMLKTLILAWAVYAGIVAAQGVWELEERGRRLLRRPARRRQPHLPTVLPPGLDKRRPRRHRNSPAARDSPHDRHRRPAVLLLHLPVHRAQGRLRLGDDNNVRSHSRVRTGDSHHRHRGIAEHEILQPTARGG